MQIHRHIRLLCTLFLLFALPLMVGAQYGFQLDIKKPEPYDNRELKAEKTGDKKLKAPKRFMQNMTTHYNYFFNASNKLNEILQGAKAAHKDDYSTLLPFYNYSLNTTASDSAQLDSVIYKAKAGIVLHDLRNDWIDDLYLLWGAAYYLQQDFDSAYGMFQFINYAFAEKEKDGYYKYIGSRMDGNAATSIATAENRNLAKRIISEPPGRNTAFIWQVRTLIEQEAYPEAGSLIAALRNDPVFPARLGGALEEVQAYWFYKQGLWDSAAYHLVKALGEAGNKQEKARWEYLIAQLFERKGLQQDAKDWYAKSIVHTTDPVLEVYARLNLIRNTKDQSDGYIDRNIEALLKMAKRDKYEEYRDVIYSMAAQMELERGGFAAAQILLIAASRYGGGNVAATNRTYLQLADLSYNRRDYQNAAAFYDSIKLQNLVTEDAERIGERKRILSRLMKEWNVVQRQDSLQRIALLSEGDRRDYVKRLVRQLRRQEGLKEEEVLTAGGLSSAPDPFSPAAGKGEWYFYNSALKKSGAANFIQAWGTRPNVDNWRRFSDVTAELRKTNAPDPSRGTAVPVISDAAVPYSFDVLYNRLPLTPEALQRSNDSIRSSLLAMGRLYQAEMEDYVSALAVYEEIAKRFPANDPSAELLFGLYFNYLKTGNITKAAEAKKALLQKYPTDRYAVILATGKDPQSTAPTDEVTKTYEGVYDLFLEGKFDEAKTAKATADSLYNTNYWSPQLLYIEAVYHIRQREDSIAKSVLNKLLRQSSGTPIAAKAQNLIDVLSRRTQIEDELSKLQIERPAEDTLFVEPMPVAPAVVKQDVAINNKPKDTLVTKVIPVKPLADTAQKKPPAVSPSSLYTYKPDAPYYAVVVLNRVDPVFVNEARNAFNRYTKEKFYSQPLDIKSVTISDEIKFVLIGTFNGASGAVDYVQKTKPVAGGQVVPWLKADKYSFTIISADNLQALMGAKDFTAYKIFLDQNLPVKF